MRSRTITVDTDIPTGNFSSKQYWVPTGAFVRETNDVSPLVPAYVTSTDSIVDQTPQMKSYGACLHSVEHWKPNFSGVTIAYTHFPDKYVNESSGGYWFYNRCRPYFGTWLTPLVVVRPPDWDELSYDAMERMRPSFSKASFFNDLLELRQIADLINPLGVKKGFLKRVRERGQSAITRLDELQAGANMHLWYQFGIKPAVESAQEVYRLIRELPEIIRKLRQQESKVVTRHYSCGMMNVDLPADATVYDSGGTSVTREARWIVAPTYHATVRYKLDISSLSDLELKVRAWGQALGLDRPLSVVWNAIPLSFVVDWFVDIGKWLGSLTPSNSVIPIVVLDFCQSAKFEYVVSAVCHENVPFSSDKVSVFVGSRTVRTYDRRHSPPATVSRVRFGLPTLGQLFTLASLGVQRIEKRKPIRQPPRPRWLKFPKVSR